ncbi:NAD(P)-dependent oxidoreductase, partial [uncultured Desulfovibrio sp.]|uniref:NAD-dependent epimerase/dehydratase family protein n=1 Tax=uncultured Desulfovibrio sp. TaxID=167968 RepID=UPI00261DC39B
RQGMVSIFLAMMLNSGHIHVKGSLDRYRDFVYIDDVVRAFLLCLSHPESAGYCINIGGSGRVTVKELLDNMAALHPEPVSVRCEGTTAGDMHGIHADGSLARRLLGYEPQVPLVEGLRRMYEACRK